MRVSMLLALARPSRGRDAVLLISDGAPNDSATAGLMADVLAGEGANILTVDIGDDEAGRRFLAAIAGAGTRRPDPAWALHIAPLVALESSVVALLAPLRCQH